MAAILGVHQKTWSESVLGICGGEPSTKNSSTAMILKVPDRKCQRDGLPRPRKCWTYSVELLENFGGSESQRFQRLWTGRLHIDYHILKHRHQEGKVQKFKSLDRAGCGPNLNRQGHPDMFGRDLQEDLHAKSRKRRHQREHAIETTETNN